ncbi:polyprenyl synthetase family protein [Limimaricola cinnabarinus]|uniref:Geranylgeranyl diphosphate synthase n=1 Tax=Limimaricola cinnabarinus LL-001 TaxID=1337093 RepID=U3AJ15_9RHOB|nr:polyprenyl synthetase family protein [Limimaricola cinnabarinus]GAD54783.1 octaprenyl-diphosphate synthase / dimethylallyltransferase / geranyltranstransferase (farnesyldiphosphate synthase) / geranylgeranyl pyrophosphate synthetase [Limimaricola cinnabarinus LL-001]
MAEGFGSALAQAGRETQALLRERLAGHDLPVARAMEHGVMGGKGLRGFLVLEGARLHGVTREAARLPAAGIEALHAYSLVHDDLPAMDDDDLRRGQPTVHVAWDEATAILAGDALQSLAFELCADPAVGPHRADLCLSLARAGGIAGMVGGQARDIMAESADAPLDLDQITELQQGKTGALIRWSAEAGAVMAGADARPLGRYAAALGLAFQIADDILDVEGDAEKMGKALRKDAGAGKATFVSLLGLEAARTRAAELIETACDALSPYGAQAGTLRDAARFVIARDN